MHASSFNRIKDFVGLFMDPLKPYNILDVGSYDVNGTYKPIFTNPLWTYTGCDIAAGPNVDIVIDGYSWTNIPSESYDVVLSGQTLEHTKMPWKTVAEIARVAKPGALIMLTAPWSFMIHRYPIDCWRILPDGMRVLMDDVAGLEVMIIENNQTDCFGVGRKKL